MGVNVFGKVDSFKYLKSLMNADRVGRTFPTIGTFLKNYVSESSICVRSVRLCRLVTKTTVIIFKIGEIFYFVCSVNDFYMQIYLK